LTPAGVCAGVYALLAGTLLAGTLLARTLLAGALLNAALTGIIAITWL